MRNVPLSEIPPLEMGRRSAILFGVALALLTIPLLASVQVFASHLIYLVFVAFSALFCAVRNPKYFGNFIVWLVVVFGVNLFSVLYFSPAGRYMGDTFKILIYVGSIAFVGYAFSNKTLRNIGFGLGIGLPIFILFSIFVLKSVSPHGERLILDGVGGPNTFGAMISLALLFTLAQRNVSLLVRASIVIILILALLATGSRANILGFAVAAFFGPHLIKRAGVAGLAAMGLVLLAFATLDVDQLLKQLNGLQRLADAAQGNTSDVSSGRSGIWAFLINDALKDPVSILFGKGPGSAEFMHLVLSPVFWSKQLLSPHSTWVGSFYYFGLMGLTILACCFIYAAVSAWRSTDLLRKRIFIFYMMTTLVDNHYMSSQGIVFHALALAILFSPLTRDPEPTQRPATPSAGQVEVPPHGLPA